MQKRYVMAQVVRYLFCGWNGRRLVRHRGRRVLAVPNLILVLLELFANVVLIIVKALACIGNDLVVLGFGVFIQSEASARSVWLSAILFKRVERRKPLHRVKRPCCRDGKRSHLVYSRGHAY